MDVISAMEFSGHKGLLVAKRHDIVDEKRLRATLVDVAPFCRRPVADSSRT